MKLILPEILTLMQHYLLQGSNQYNFDNIQCIHCGSTKLWKHGCYFRKSDRDNKTNESLNPIPIQRFLCTSCKKTCSALPECIPPRRWYLWEIQQLVFILFLAGKSIYAIAKETIPSRYTISRWINNLKINFKLHKSVLCQYFIDLGRTKDFTEFWRNCLKNTTLSKTMLICNFAGVNIP
jgi:transposase-like protein